MTTFHHQAHQPPAIISPAVLAPSPGALPRDVLWGRPLFKAPRLPNPRIAFDPLPFTATRITHRPVPAAH
ncbi:MAG: hypothetical protein HY302_04325 [Opitutae bacterium]|nr:hypothetical protein [Opitutae bacterium]